MVRPTGWLLSLALLGSVDVSAQQWDSATVTAAFLADTASRSARLSSVESTMRMAAYVKMLPMALQGTADSSMRVMLASTIAQNITPEVDVDGFASQVAATVVAGPSEPAVRQEVVALIRDESVRLRAQFALADALKSTAQAMALVTPDEAARVVGAVDKWDLITTGVSTALAALGGVAYLNGNGRDAGGWVSLSALVSVIRPLAGGSGKGLANSTNAALAKTTERLHQRASQLAVHSYLTLQLEQKGAALTSIAQRSREVAAVPDPATVTQSAAREAAATFTRLLTDIDRFYDIDLTAMADDLDAQAKKSFFTDASKTKMVDLAGQLRDAVEAWHSARRLYQRSGDVAEGYIKTYAT